MLFLLPLLLGQMAVRSISVAVSGVSQFNLQVIITLQNSWDRDEQAGNIVACHRPSFLFLSNISRARKVRRLHHREHDSTQQTLSHRSSLATFIARTVIALLLALAKQSTDTHPVITFFAFCAGKRAKKIQIIKCITQYNNFASCQTSRRRHCFECKFVAPVLLLLCTGLHFLSVCDYIIY